MWLCASKHVVSKYTIENFQVPVLCTAVSRVGEDFALYVSLQMAIYRRNM